MFGNVFGGDHHHPDWLTTGYDPSPAARSALWPSATPLRLPSRSDSHGVPESDIRTIYCTHSDNLRPQKSLTWLQRRQTPWQGRAAGWQCTGSHVEWTSCVSVTRANKSQWSEIDFATRPVPATYIRQRTSGRDTIPPVWRGVGALNARSSACTASRPARRHNHR